LTLTLIVILIWAAAASTALVLFIRRVKALRCRQAELESENQKQNRRLGELESEFNSVCYSISHDLRAPLRSVHGFSQIILRNYRAKLDEDGRQFLGIIEANASQMNQMIEDVLMYSRLARREMSMTELNMNELVQKTIDEIRNLTPGRRLEFRVQALPGARGDVHMIRQVWFQLIHNAVKYTRPRQDALIEIEGRTDDGRKVYCIKDNGIGFDMQYAGKLFGLFQRLVSSDEFEGNGSGLAMVKRILIRHGGTAWGEAKPGAGSVFGFSLPR
jgi:light-regulated signal transduction histidine kinase (bacteriophytochrome)